MGYNFGKRSEIMNLYLVRHGQDNENVRGDWCNHGLIEEGIEQSKILGKNLADIFLMKFILVI